MFFSRLATYVRHQVKRANLSLKEKADLAEVTKTIPSQLNRSPKMKYMLSDKWLRRKTALTISSGTKVTKRQMTHKMTIVRTYQLKSWKKSLSYGIGITRRKTRITLFLAVNWFIFNILITLELSNKPLTSNSTFVGRNSKHHEY